MDQDAEGAWATEVNGRVSELDSGTVKNPGQKSVADSAPANASVRVEIRSADEAETAERYYREQNETVSTGFVASSIVLWT